MIVGGQKVVELMNFPNQVRKVLVAPSSENFLSFSVQLESDG